jgi:hypothetical protein
MRLLTRVDGDDPEGCKVRKGWEFGGIPCIEYVKFSRSQTVDDRGGTGIYDFGIKTKIPGLFPLFANRVS